MQNLTFFEKNIGKIITRGTTKILVESLEMANRLFYLQDLKKGYLFSEQKEDSLEGFFADAKPAIRIHRAITECESCSA
jgi:hypothetical protein